MSAHYLCVLPTRSLVLQKVSKRKSRKGATKRRQPFPIKQFARALGRGVIIGLVGVGLFAGGRLLVGMEFKLMPVNNIVLATPLVYQDEVQLMSTVDVYKNSSLLWLDVSELASTVEALPWIRSAAVQKQWPASLKVTVTEHEPVAVWNQSTVLNSDGLPLERPVAQMSLAELSGPAGKPEMVMTQYLQFGQIFQEEGYRVTAVDLKARGAWTITLNLGVKIRLGEKDVLKRSRRVVKVLNSLSADVEQIELIDARYPNGAAIRYKQDKAEVENDIAA